MWHYSFWSLILSSIEMIGSCIISKRFCLNLKNLSHARVVSFTKKEQKAQKVFKVNIQILFNHYFLKTLFLFESLFFEINYCVEFSLIFFWYSKIRLGYASRNNVQPLIYNFVKSGWNVSLLSISGTISSQYYPWQIFCIFYLTCTHQYFL